MNKLTLVFLVGVFSNIYAVGVTSDPTTHMHLLEMLNISTKQLSQFEDSVTELKSLSQMLGGIEANQYQKTHVSDFLLSYINKYKKNCSMSNNTSRYKQAIYANRDIFPEYNQTKLSFNAINNIQSNRHKKLQHALKQAIFMVSAQKENIESTYNTLKDLANKQHTNNIQESLINLNQIISLLLLEMLKNREIAAHQLQIMALTGVWEMSDWLGAPKVLDNK